MLTVETEANGDSWNWSGIKQPKYQAKNFGRNTPSLILPLDLCFNNLICKCFSGMWAMMTFLSQKRQVCMCSSQAIVRKNLVKIEKLIACLCQYFVTILSICNYNFYFFLNRLLKRILKRLSTVAHLSILNCPLRSWIFVGAQDLWLNWAYITYSYGVE